MDNNKLHSSVAKVTAILPVYNSEQYVERAVVSLMEQTLDDVQIIIIDDGSNDNSLSIIQQLIARYPERKDKVILISRENQGVAATRAQGMEMASGNYIIHLDSDDWAESNWLEMMYCMAVNDNADIVVCDYNTVYAEKTVHQRQHIGCDGVDSVKKLLTGELHGSTWNKLIRRALIVDHGLKFPKNINYLEDFIFVMQAFLNAHKIAHVAKPLVNYNQMNESSITSSINHGKVNEIVAATDVIEGIISSSSILPSDFLCYLNSFKLNQKNWMLYCNRKKIPSYVCYVYPEITPLILSCLLPIRKKVILYVASHGFGGLASFLFHLVEKLEQNALRFGLRSRN